MKLKNMIQQQQQQQRLLFVNLASSKHEKLVELDKDTKPWAQSGVTVITTC